MPRKEYPCTNCEKLCTQRCSACKAPYCSRQCQKIDRRRHKLVCTYQSDKKKTKPANSSPPAVRGPEPVYEPEIDSDFDCIDISLDINRPIGKDVSKKKIENVAQSPDRNVTRDSGYTSQKDDMRTNTCCEGVHSSSNTGTVSTYGLFLLYGRVCYYRCQYMLEIFKVVNALDVKFPIK